MKLIERICIVLTCALLFCAPALANDALIFPADLTEIRAEAFMGDISISEVIVPEGVKTIGARAFADSGLREITLPKSLTEIAPDAFDGCADFIITAPEGSYACKWAQEMGFDVRTACDFEYEISDSGVVLTAYTGSDTSVIVPDSIAGQKVVELSYTFYNNQTVTSVSLPASVTRQSYAFYGCTGLTEITVDPASSAFAGRDGVLYRKGASGGVESLVCYPAGKTAEFYQIPDGVLKIDVNAFTGCGALREIGIPNSVNFINEFAFDDTPGLERFTVGPANSAYSDSDGVLIKSGEPLTLFCYPSGKTDVSYTVPKYVTGMNNQAYMDNPYMESITLPSGMTRIPSYAFTNYTALRTLTIPEGVTNFGSTICNGCTSLTRVELPETLEVFDWENFADCPNLEYINLPASLTYIGKMNFVNCPKLIVHVDEGSLAHEWCIANNVKFSTDTEPNDAADFTVENLTSTACAITGYTGERTKVVIPEKIGNRTVTTIAHSAFSDNTQITSVTIPGTVTTIDYYAFYRCSSLRKVSLGSGIKTIRGQAFYGCSFEEIVFPDSVTTLEPCLGYVNELASVTLPANLTAIPGEMFMGCDSLKTLAIPSKVTVIRQNAFTGSGLSELTLPASVKTIEKYAFDNCMGLTKIYIPSTVTSIGEGAFRSSVEIHCAKGSAAAKWAAGNGNKVVYE